MEKFVITIGREYGSGGRGIAHRLADALGIRYYDKELIRMASAASARRCSTLPMKSWRINSCESMESPREPWFLSRSRTD